MWRRRSCDPIFSDAAHFPRPLFKQMTMKSADQIRGRRFPRAVGHSACFPRGPDGSGSLKLKLKSFVLKRYLLGPLNVIHSQNVWSPTGLRLLLPARLPSLAPQTATRACCSLAFEITSTADQGIACLHYHYIFDKISANFGVQI